MSTDPWSGSDQTGPESAGDEIDRAPGGGRGQREPSPYADQWVYPDPEPPHETPGPPQPMTGPTHHRKPAQWETYPGQAAYPAHPIQPGYPVQASYAVQPIHPVQPAYPIPYPAAYGGYAPVTPPKSSGVAYLLWFFLGGFGVHHFYLNRPAWGAAYIALNVLGWATAIFLVGFVLLIPLWILLLVDLFMIPSYTQTANVRFITYR